MAWVPSSLTRVSLILLLGVVGLSSPGCTFARTKINVEEFHQKIETIEVGKTKGSEVIELLGSPPNAILQLGEERSYVYTFGDGKTGGLNLFLFSSRKTNLGVDSAYFFVDDNDVVVRKIVSNNSEDLSWDWWAFGD